jgi:predicted amidohydrolase
MKEHTVTRALRVASVQMESAPSDKAANFAKVETFVRQAAAQGVQLIAFPECCLTGYQFRTRAGPPRAGIRPASSPLKRTSSCRASMPGPESVP